MLQLELLQLVREEEKGANNDVLLTFGTAVGAGVAVVFIIALIRLFFSRKASRRRTPGAAAGARRYAPALERRRAEDRGDQLTLPYGFERPHVVVPLPPRDFPMQPSAAYIGGRQVVQTATQTPVRAEWAQYPYPAHVAGFYAQPLPNGRAFIQTVGTEQPRVVPRFNPDNLVSFDASGDDKKSPCPICLGLLEEEPVSTGQCLHLMHTSCLKSWLAKDVKSACPVCRVTYQDPEADEEDAAAAATERASSTVPALPIPGYPGFPVR